MGDLGHDLPGEGQALRVAQIALQAKQRFVQALHLAIALVRLGRRLLHARLELVVEGPEARHHFVEVVGEEPELVGRVAPDDGRLIAPSTRRMASRNRRMGRFTTRWTATVMSAPINRTEAAVSRSAQLRVRSASASARSNEIDGDRSGHGVLDVHRGHDLPVPSAIVGGQP